MSNPEKLPISLEEPEKEAEKTPQEESQRFTSEERRRFGASRGAETRRAMRADEFEKTESGYKYSEEYIEKARSEMETDLDARVFKRLRF